MLLGLELVFFVILLVLLWYMFECKFKNNYERFPGPRPYPIIGNLLEFDYPKEEVTDTLKKLSYKYGPVCLMRIGCEPVVLLRNPADVEVVLGDTSVLDKAPLYWPLMPWLKQGLLTSGGETWKRHRKMLTPAFHFKILEKFIPVFAKNSNILADKLSKTIGEDVDITPGAALCALDIIYETAMGIEINAQLKDSKYVDTVNELQEIVAHRNFDIMQRSFLFPWLRVGKKHDQLIAYLHNVTENIIREKKQKLENSVSSNEDTSSVDSDIGIRQKKAFLDLILEYNREGDVLTDSEIRDEIHTFVFGGYDTTTSTVSFCLHNISQYPDVQEKVYEEIRAIFGESDREPTYQDLMEMKYLEKVIKESLRVYPTGQFVARMTNKPIKLNSGYIIPKNTSVMVLIEAMNHDPALHPDPHTFNPDRFEGRSLHPYAFVPFGAGSRNCIGQKFAMLEMKTVISQLLKRFTLCPSDVPITPWFSVVLRSSTGVHLRVEPRRS